MINSEAKISVVIPVYNSIDYLEECLESVLNQTYPCFDVILVDDGSNDGSERICDKYAQKDMRIRVIHQPNRGQCYARKVGLLETNTEYVYYVDSDDWLDSDMVETFMRILQEYEVSMISTGIKREYGGGRFIEDPLFLTPGFYDKAKKEQLIVPSIINTDKFYEWGQMLTMWHFLTSRQLLLENLLKIDDGIRIGEDTACMYPCLIDASSVYVCDNIYYHYRQRKDSQKSKGGLKDYSLFAHIHRRLMEKVSGQKNEELLIKQIKYTTWFNILFAVPETVLFRNGCFPFRDFAFSSKIVVYGAGTFGMKVIEALVKDERPDIVSWVDRNYQKYQSEGYLVVAPEVLYEESYDYVIVAVIRADIREGIVRELLNNNVPSEKIVDIDVRKIDGMSLPRIFTEKQECDKGMYDFIN